MSSVNIKASIRYIQNRAGKDRQKITRTLFGIDGELEREEAYTMIDEAQKGTRFFRFVISPDPQQEDRGKDLQLWEITTKTMLGLEERLSQTIQFVAAVHNDHAPKRHVHVIALVRANSPATILCCFGKLQQKRRSFREKSLIWRGSRESGRKRKELNKN